LLGITIPAVIAGSLAIVTVAGAKALDPEIKGFGYLEAVQSIGGGFAAVAPWMLLAGSIPASVFIASMFSDSFAVIVPGTPRLGTTMIAATMAAVLAISGIPGDLVRFLTIAAALCAPVAGIMAADYWSHERRWPHPRPGVNYAGYGAWLLGLLCGLLPLLPIPEQFTGVVRPAALYSCVAGFAGYIVLGNIGLKPYQRHRRKRVRLDTWDEEARRTADASSRRSRTH
jgi:cytosine permease